MIWPVAKHQVSLWQKDPVFFYLHKELKTSISASILVIFPPFSEVPATLGATGSSYNSRIKIMITPWGGYMRLEMLKRKCHGDWSRDLRIFVSFRFLRNHLLAKFQTWSQWALMLWFTSRIYHPLWGRKGPTPLFMPQLTSTTVWINAINLYVCPKNAKPVKLMEQWWIRDTHGGVGRQNSSIEGGRRRLSTHGGRSRQLCGSREELTPLLLLHDSFFQI